MLMLVVCLLYFGWTTNTECTVQNFYWRNYIPGHIPYDAIELTLGKYIGQISHHGELPATIYSHSQIAVTDYNGKVSGSTFVRILCTSEPNRFFWESVDFNKSYDSQMVNAIVGGFQNNGINLHVGKAYHEEEWKVGRVIAINDQAKGLYIFSNAGQSVKIMEFSILKYYPGVVGIGRNIQDFYWRVYIPGEIPCDAFESAPGLYIGQVHRNGLLPATIYPHTKIAVTEMNGKFVHTNYIKILCSPDNRKLHWEHVDLKRSSDGQMKNVIEGGVQGDTQVLQFIGKAYHEGEWKIGRVISIEYPEIKGLYIWNKDNQQVRLLEFYILKYNSRVDQSKCSNMTVCNTGCRH